MSSAALLGGISPVLGSAAAISLRSECFLEAEPERARRCLLPTGIALTSPGSLQAS